MSEIASWIVWIPMIGLGLFLALELWLPARASVQSKWLRVSTNVTIAGSNAIMVNFLYGAFFLTLTPGNSGGWGLLDRAGVGPTGNVIASVLLLDLTAYGMHRVLHGLPFLWRFHRAHHSDLDIDATTALRFHPGEALFSVGIQVMTIAVLGVSWLGWIIFAITSPLIGLFSHSNVRFPGFLDRVVRSVLVSPQMHWVHHSQCPADHDTNFGVIFSVWDRLLGTYRLGAKREEIQAGLDQYPSPDHVSLVPFCAMPLGPGCRPSTSP